jgi:hypothetical protein
LAFSEHEKNFDLKRSPNHLPAEFDLNYRIDWLKDKYLQLNTIGPYDPIRAWFKTKQLLCV